MKHGFLRPLPLLATLLGLLLLMLAACEVAGWPFLRQPLARQMSSKLQRDVRLDGNFSLHLLGSVRLQVGRLRISAPGWDQARGGQADFVTAQDTRLVLPYRSVLGQLQGSNETLQVKLLEVDSIDARLVRQADGRANWHFEVPARGEVQPAEAIPEFVHLIVHKGRVTLQDDLAHLHFTAQARTEEGTARDAAGLFVRASGDYQGQDFTAEARSPGLLPLVAPRGRSATVAVSFNAHLTDPKRADSELRFQGKAQDLLHFEGLSGHFSLSGPSLAVVGDAMHVTLPTTSAFTMVGDVAKQGPVWDVRVAAFDVARTHLSGSIRYDMAAARPKAVGKLGGSRLMLKDLAPAFGASPNVSSNDEEEAPATTHAAGARVLPQREFDIPSLQRMDADIDIDIDKVDFGSKTLLPLQPLRGRLTLEGGVLTLEHLLAHTADGELQGMLRIDPNAEEPLWTADVKWSGIRLSQWLNVRNRFARDTGSQAAAAPEVKTRKEKAATGTAEEKPLPYFVTGELAGQAKLKGRGRSTAAMLASLEGDTQLWIRNGTVSHLLIEAVGLDIAQGLGVILKGDENLPLRCAAVSLKGDKGLFRTEAGIVDTRDSLLLLNGQVSLAQERFDLTLEAKPHDRSLLAIRAPIHLRGNFAAPKVRPDLQKVGRKAVLATVLGTLLAPLAALVPLVDPGASSKGEGCSSTLALLKQNPATPPAMKRAVSGKR